MTTTAATTMSSWEIFTNTLPILSNLAFIVVAVCCFKLKKHVQFFIYAAITITSSLYHTCKFGYENQSSEAGICLFYDFNVYFRLDHTTAMLTVPLIMLAFNPLDVVVYDFLCGDDNTEVVRVNRKQDVNQFLLENCFSSDLSISPSNMEHFYALRNKSIKKKKSMENDKHAYQYFAQVNRLTVRKPNMVGLENILVCMYAYIIAVVLIDTEPGVTFTVLLGLSSLGLTCTIGLYYYVIYGIKVTFEPKRFALGLVLSFIACCLMAFQETIIPGEFYWLSHAIWHVVGAIGHYFLLISKRRYIIYCQHNTVQK